MTEPAQCPGCNRWSDRNDAIQEIHDDFSHLDADRYFACLAPDCEVYKFAFGASGPHAGFKLNADSLGSGRKTLVDLKKEKLSHHESLDF